jgi:hypothetical protein
VKRIVCTLALLTIAIVPLFGYKIRYAEQFYRLYHLHLYQSSDNTMENIYWLEQALKADFCNPLYALAKIESKEEWRHYRYLFKMHVNLKLVELYRTLGSRYDKRIAYFYNAPWKRQNLESLEIAEKMFRLSLHYWRQALSWARKLGYSPHYLEEIQFWEDERARIRSGELDYGDIIGEDLERLLRARAQFESMDADTY